VAASISIEANSAAFTLTGFPNTWIGPFDNLALARLLRAGLLVAALETTASAGASEAPFRKIACQRTRR